jgi:hypothetical protein
MIAGVAYAEPLPLDGVAAKHYTDQEPPVPAWDALALASVARNRTSCGRCAATCRMARLTCRQGRRQPLPGHGSRRALFSGRGT